MTQLGLSQHETNESGADWRMWALGAVWAFALICGGAWMSIMDRRIVVLEDSERAGGGVRERLSAAEVRQSSTQRQLDDDVKLMRESMKRVEEKLDQLIYRDLGAAPPGAGARRFDK